jgi:hypothetical protein
MKYQKAPIGCRGFFYAIFKLAIKKEPLNEALILNRFKYKNAVYCFAQELGLQLLLPLYSL